CQYQDQLSSFDPPARKWSGRASGCSRKRPSAVPFCPKSAPARRACIFRGTVQPVCCSRYALTRPAGCRKIVGWQTVSFVHIRFHYIVFFHDMQSTASILHEKNSLSSNKKQTFCE